MKTRKESLKDQLAQIESDADDLKRELKTIEAAEASQALEPLKMTATRAHDLLCQWNHTDGCAWLYEMETGDPWRANDHARWLSKIGNIVHGSSYEKSRATVDEINVILDSVQELKGRVPAALWLLRGGLVP